MKINSILFLLLTVVFFISCKNSKDVSGVNQIGTNKNETIQQGSDADTLTASKMSEQINLLSTVNKGGESQLWSLNEVKDFFHKNRIGEAAAPAGLDDTLYFDEGEAFAGIGIHLNSYKYLNMYYKNILDNWEVLRNQAPGVYLSKADAELVVKFANITEAEFQRQYPNWASGEKVD